MRVPYIWIDGKSLENIVGNHITSVKFLPGMLKVKTYSRTKYGEVTKSTHCFSYESHDIKAEVKEKEVK